MEDKMMLKYYLLAGFTLISATVSLTFAIAAFRSARGVSTAQYALARSSAIFLAACGLLFFPARSYVIALAAIMTFVQLLDAVIGIRVSLFKTVGPLMTAVLNAALLFWYLV